MLCTVYIKIVFSVCIYIRCFVRKKLLAFSSTYFNIYLCKSIFIVSIMCVCMYTFIYTIVNNELMLCGIANATRYTGNHRAFLLKQIC